MARMGDSLGSKCRMMGSSTLGGSERRMRATLACTSCCASLTSTLRLNVMRTFELPSCDDHLHSTAERTDVADDHAVALREAVDDLRLAGAIVDDADLNGRDVERLAGDAIHERLAVFRRLPHRGRWNHECARDNTADDA